MTQISIELFSTAVLLLNYSLLVYSDYGKKTLLTLLWGMLLGIAALTKFTFFLYIIGPITLLVFSKMTSHRQIKALTAVVLGAVIALPWYIYNSGNILLEYPKERIQSVGGISEFMYGIWLFFVCLYRESGKEIFLFMLSVAGWAIFIKPKRVSLFFRQYNMRILLAILAPIFLFTVYFRSFQMVQDKLFVIEFYIWAGWLSFLFINFIYFCFRKVERKIILRVLLILSVYSHIYSFNPLKQIVSEGVNIAQDTHGLVRYLYDSGHYHENMLVVNNEECRLSNEFRNGFCSYSTNIEKSLLYFRYWYGMKVIKADLFSWQRETREAAIRRIKKRGYKTEDCHFLKAGRRKTLLGKPSAIPGIVLLSSDSAQTPQNVEYYIPVNDDIISYSYKQVDIRNVLGVKELWISLYERI